MQTVHGVWVRGGCLVASLLASVLCPPWSRPASASDTEALPDTLLAQRRELASRKASLSPGQRKVDSILRRYAWPETAPRGRAAAPGHAPSEQSWRREGQLRVVVKVTGTASVHRPALTAAGLEIEIVNDRYGLVQGWIAEGAV